MTDQTTTAIEKLTENSRDLFLALWNDSPDWNAQPIVNVTKEDRGNLTQLKRLGLLTTFNDDGCLFTIWTPEGIEVGIKLTGMNEWGEKVA